MTDQELYGDVEKRLKNSLNRFSSKIPDENIEAINRFMTRCKARGISTHRKLFYLHKLKKIAEIVPKDFNDYTKEDIEKVMAYCEDKGYKGWTKEGYKTTLKIFFRWLKGLDRTDPAPKIVSWLEKNNPVNELKKEDLLSDSEVASLIESTNNIRDKAMISVLWEGALRPGELRGMKIKDITFNSQSLKVNVRGKMSKKQGERPIFLVQSYDLMRTWIESHPRKNNPESYVWISNGKTISHAALKQTLLRAANKAGILDYDVKAGKFKKGKYIFPYLLRHSRGTWAYKTLPIVIARKFMGHQPGSTMEKVYCHLNETDIEDAVLQQAGIKERKPEENRTKCPRCRHVNSLNAKLCSFCGLQFNITDIYSDDERIKLAFEGFLKLTEKYPGLKKECLEALEKEGF